MTTTPRTELEEAEHRIIGQTREQAITEIGADRYNQLISVFVEAHKNDPGTIGNPLQLDEPTCGTEYRPGHRDGRCSLPPGHPPIPRSGTYYQHANPDTGWWWNTLPAARCGKPDAHEPHVTNLGRWCAGHATPYAAS